MLMVSLLGFSASANEQRDDQQALIAEHEKSIVAALKVFGDFRNIESVELSTKTVKGRDRTGWWSPYKDLIPHFYSAEIKRDDGGIVMSCDRVVIVTRRGDNIKTTTGVPTIKECRIFE